MYDGLNTCVLSTLISGEIDVGHTLQRVRIVSANNIVNSDDLNSVAVLSVPPLDERNLPGAGSAET